MGRVITLLALVSALLVGCQPPQSPTGPADAVTHSETASEYADRLRKSADELAQRELSRIAAAELVYRGNATPQTHMLAIGGSVTLYMKIYRNFTGYEVLAVDQTNSLLNPISIEVRYDYDLVSTDLAQMEEEANKELQYNAFDRFFVRRVYACDKDGRPVGDLPPLPPRAEYWPHKIRLTESNRDMTGQTAPTVDVPITPLVGGNLPTMPATPPPGAMDY